jgi:hypothetical protein
MNPKKPQPKPIDFRKAEPPVPVKNRATAVRKILNNYIHHA